MTFTTSCLIAIVISVILIAEIVIASVLCAKLRKHKARLKAEKEKHKTTLHSFLLLTAAGASYQMPLVIIFVLLSLEIIYFAWMILSLVKMLRETEDAEIAEDVTYAATLVRHSITLEEAHDALSDDEALHLIEEEEEASDGTVAVVGAHHLAHKRYKNKTIINVDTLSQNFSDNEHVNLKTLKEKKLIQANADYVKVLGRGTLDKKLYVEAHAFSADAIKMVVLTGGHAIKFVHHPHHHAIQQK